MRLSVFIVLLSMVPAAHAQPARIILIRHAEKSADEQDPNLSAEGRDRAQRLVAWLTEGKVLGTNDPPAALYAAEPSNQGRGVRCVQTLEPTARHVNLPIRTPYRPDEYVKLAARLLRSASLRGKTVVVCWSHEELPQLAAALGVRPEPPKWKDKDFKSAYIITYENGKAQLEHTKQQLKKK